MSVENQKKVAIAKSYMESSLRPSLLDEDVEQNQKKLQIWTIVDGFFELSNTRKPTDEFIESTKKPEFQVVEKLALAAKLEQAGIALFGSRWQTELSASLKNADGKPLDARRIRQWLAGDYATPEWVWPQIKLLAEQRKQQIDELIPTLASPPKKV